MEWSQFWSGILGAILGSLVTGIFTIIIAKMNLKDNAKIRTEERKFLLHNNRPEFEVINCANIEKFKSSNSSLIEVLLTKIRGFDGQFMKYSEKLYNEEYLLEMSFKLKNVGKTDIDELWIATNYVKDFSIFKYGVYKKLKDCSKILQYKVCYDKIIRQDSEIKLKFIFEKDIDIYNGYSAPIALWFKDVNGNWWCQQFFVTNNIIYSSKMVKYEKFKEYTDEIKALECFRNPYLW